MANRFTFFRRELNMMLSIVLLQMQSTAQQPTHLMQFDSFFQSQRPAMEQWMNVHLPKAFLHKLEVKTDSNCTSLQLALRTPGETCAQARARWDVLEKNSDSKISQSAMKHWAFLAEAQPHEVKLLVHCCPKEHFSREYRLPPATPPEGFIARSIGTINAIAPLTMEDQNVGLDRKDGESSEMSATIRNARASDVSKKIRAYCQTKYAGLPKARYFWEADMRFTDLNATEFILEVSYITNVVAQDRYFEYHRIHVNTQPIGTDTQLKVDFRAKYGSGILFAPRRNDYKDMEIAYKADLMQYRQVFFAQVLDLFSK